MLSLILTNASRGAGGVQKIGSCCPKDRDKNSVSQSKIIRRVETCPNLAVGRLHSVEKKGNKSMPINTLAEHESPATQPLPGQPPARRLTHYLMRLLALGSTEIPTRELAKSALVFSPHPDDECLGCGGTIIRKKQAGATVKIVHMTDGSRSHATHLISRERLAATRAREALNAGALLGVDDIYFLGYQDGALGYSMGPAIQRVAEIIQRENPEEVFVPYVREPVRNAADHIVTTRIVCSALQSLRRLGATRVWEYPVWFWLQWPWVGLKKGVIERRCVALNSLQLCFGLPAFLELRHGVNISDVLERKIAALSEHRTQMTELIPSSDWGTLGKILGGQFLECFYIDYEFFRCSSGKFIVRSDPGVLGARIMSLPGIRKVARKLRGKQGPPPEFRATSTEDFATLYKEVSDPWDISKRVPHYREAWEWIFQQLPAPEPSVTDVGCGVGTFLKALMTLRPDVRAEGIEYSPVAAKKARRATGSTIHTGDITQEDCFRACQPAGLATFNDVLFILPDNGKQGMINCLRFLQPRYVLIAQSHAENDDAFAVYERSYSWNSTEASLAKIASSSFKFPPTPQWAGGTQRFVLYRVVYKKLTGSC